MLKRKLRKFSTKSTSLGVTIPAHILKICETKEGDDLEMKFDFVNKRIIIQL